MNTFDIVAIITVALFALMGYLSGFMAQVVRIVALIISYLLAVLLSPYLADQMNYSMHGTHVRFDVVAFGIVWFFAYFISSTIGYALARKLRRSSPSLSEADKFTGMFAGILKGVLLVLGITGVLLWFRPQFAPSWRGLSSQMEHSLTVKLIKEIPLPDAMRNWD